MDRVYTRSISFTGPLSPALYSPQHIGSFEGDVLSRAGRLDNYSDGLLKLEELSLQASMTFRAGATEKEFK